MVQCSNKEIRGRREISGHFVANVPFNVPFLYQHLLNLTKYGLGS